MYCTYFYCSIEYIVTDIYLHLHRTRVNIHDHSILSLFTVHTHNNINTGTVVDYKISFTEYTNTDTNTFKQQHDIFE